MDIIKSAIIIYLSIICVLVADAQSVIIPAGNISITPAYSISWMLGEPLVEIAGDTKGISKPGNQQTSETGDQVVSLTNLDISVYPNPASEFIIMKINDFKNVSYMLYDEKGKLLKSDKISDRTTEISVVNLLPGNYFLKLSGINKDIKVFKILKSK